MLNPCVYILASGHYGTLYIGVTSNLGRRLWEHRTGAIDGFTKKYEIKRLVYFEEHATMSQAIAREKSIKKWNQAWKIALIERTNPEWRDMYDAVVASINGFPLSRE